MQTTKETAMIRSLAFVAAARSLSACATVTRGTNDVLGIQSTPPAT